MAPQTLETPSYALASIAAAYGLAFLPFYYGTLRMLFATKGNGMDLSMPRSNDERVKTKIPKEVWESIQRGKAAHFNALEGFPFFAAAMIAGTVAGLPSDTMNNAAKQYLGIRVLYTVLYIVNSSKNLLLSVARSSMWGLSVAVPGWVLLKAGNVL